MVAIKLKSEEHLIDVIKASNAYKYFIDDQLDHKIDREQQAWALLEKNRGKYSVDALNQIFDTVDFFEPNKSWFGNLLCKPNRNLIFESSLEHINNWLEELLFSDHDIQGKINNCLKTLKIKGASQGLTTLLLYLSNPEKYNIWIGKTQEGLHALNRIDDLSNSDMGNTYIRFNNAANKFKDNYKFQPYAIDWILYYIASNVESSDDHFFINEDKLKMERTHGTVTTYMNGKELKQLFENFIKKYDQDRSRALWKKQSQQFRQFWEERIMQEDDSELTEEEMQPIIWLLDANAKGIRDSGAEAACKPYGITQTRWYRLFRELKSDYNLKTLSDRLFNANSDEEQIKLINEIYESYHNALTHKTANILNDLLFVYNPERELSIASLNHRYQIIDFFELGSSKNFENLSHGEKVVHSRNMLVEMKEKLGLDVDNRVFAIAFYKVTPEGEAINNLWSPKKEKKGAPKRKKASKEAIIEATEDSDKPMLTRNKVSKKAIIEDEELSFELEEGDEPVEIDLQDRRVYSEKSDRTIFELSHQNKRGRLKLNPEFQRYYIWDENTASRLIESVFLEIPIPVIYLAEDESGNYSVIDGQQRLKSLFRFLDNDLQLKGLQVYRELNAKRYQDLSTDLQNKFENYTIRVIEIRQESHSVVKFEIFERLNRGSFKLNDQELRNCIYRGNYNDLLKELSEDKDFMYLLGLKEPHKRMFDRELVLRFLSFYNNTYLKYIPPMKRFYNLDMEAHKDLSTEETNELRSAFKKTVQLTKTVFGGNAFKRFMPGTEKDQNGFWERTRVNQALFDVIMFGFTQYDKNQVVPLADAVREELIWLMNHDMEFIDSILISTSSKSKVFTRFEKWIHSLKDVLGAPDTETRAFSLSFKEQLFNANQTCSICSQRIHTVDDSEVDHIDFYWRGGKTIPSNARLVHRYCNRARGGRS